MIRGAETVHSTVVNRRLYRRLDENFSAAFRTLDLLVDQRLRATNAEWQL